MSNPMINKADGGSYSIEWIFDGHRFALTLDENIEDSGWYAVSDCDKRLFENGPLPAHWNRVLFDLLEKTKPGEEDFEWADRVIVSGGL